MKVLKSLFLGRTCKSYFVRILSILTLCTIPFWYHYRIIYVDGISMTPTYDDGQWTLMQRVRSLGTNWTPERFDVVVVWSQDYETKLCKRVIGLPGETVEVVQGRIFIDGDEISDSFGKGNMVFQHLVDPNTEETWGKEYENIPPKTITLNHVWVIGDYREDTHFGHFPIKEIQGKIVLY